MGNVWEAMQKHDDEESKRSSGEQDASKQQKSKAADSGDRAESGDSGAGAKSKGSSGSAKSGGSGGLGQFADDGKATGQSEKAKKAATGPETVAAMDEIGPSGGGGRVDSAVGDSYPHELVVHHDRGGALAEQYRGLRTNVLTHCPEGGVCLGITSAEMGEGKTVTCLNLGLVLAELPSVRVVMVDGDLRKRTLTILSKVNEKPGVVDVLRGTCSLNEAMQSTAYPNLDVLPSGRAEYHELGEILGGFQRSDIIKRLQLEYDCVLVDMPPVGVVSDAGVIGRSVGDTLLVVRMHKTNRTAVERAVSLLRAAEIGIAGMFLTHQKTYVPKYLGRYYY